MNIEEDANPCFACKKQTGNTIDTVEDYVMVKLTSFCRLEYIWECVEKMIELYQTNKIKFCMKKIICSSHLQG